MHPISVLPNTKITACCPISEQFCQRGLRSFHDACQWVQDLPYGYNSQSEDSLILFEDGHGTCTTKHGAIAHLAASHGLPVVKTLGFYRLNDEIVTGVNALLASYQLSFIPQVHCFLVYADYRVDLTAGNCNGKNKIIEDYDFVVPVQPDPSKAEKRAIYLEHLHQYGAIAPELAALTEVQVFDLLAQCDRQVQYQCSLMGV